jgi:hypothetical protein
MGGFVCLCLTGKDEIPIDPATRREAECSFAIGDRPAFQAPLPGEENEFIGIIGEIWIRAEGSNGDPGGGGSRDEKENNEEKEER